MGVIILIKNIIDKLHYSVLRLKAKRELGLNQKRYKNGEHIILEDREYYQPVDKKNDTVYENYLSPGMYKENS